MVTKVMCTVAAGTKGALEQQGAKRFSGAFSNSKPVSSFPSPKLNAHINTGDVIWFPGLSFFFVTLRVIHLLWLRQNLLFYSWYLFLIYMHKVIEVLKHELCFTRRCLQLLGGIREKKKLLAWKLITGLRLIKMTSHFCNIKGKYIGLHYLFLVFGTHFILNVLSGVQRKLEMANQNQVSLGPIFVVLGFLFSNSCCCLFFPP